MHDLPSQSEQPDQEPKAFLALVDSLELAADGRELNGRGRAKFLQAYRDAPRGLAKVTHRAIHEAEKNAIGLALWMVDRGLHLKAERAAELNGDDVKF